MKLRNNNKSLARSSLCLIFSLFLLCSFLTTITAQVVSSSSSSSSSSQQPTATQSSLVKVEEEEEESSIGLACHRLFGDTSLPDSQLASYCHCKDFDSTATATRQQIDFSIHISQLSCYPKSLAQFGSHLREFLYIKTGNSSMNHHSLTHTLRIDYLNINTNLTNQPSFSASKQQQQNYPDSFFPSKTGNKPLVQTKSLLIDHISLQFTFTEKEKEKENHKSITEKILTGERGTFEDENIQEQMIDFVRLINETHLQFLSIFLESNKSPADSSSSSSSSKGEEQVRREISLTKLLAKLPSLSRLQLSLQGKSHSLSLEPDQFKEQKATLKWLNLASNKRLNLPMEPNEEEEGGRNISSSPFSSCHNLEYLSLEENNLHRFPLLSFLSSPFKASSTSSTFYYGLPNLTSLNLASNKLRSFEQDLFRPSKTENGIPLVILAETTCYSAAAAALATMGSSKHDKHFRVFLLPALTQLDLSRNQLSDMSFKVGQYLLCSMPNLNQIYLQHNKIIHLNLNSLLFHPSPIPHSLTITNSSSHNQPEDDDDDDDTSHHPSITATAIATTTTNNKIRNPQQTSKLEYVDLSHNSLVSITGIQFNPAQVETLSQPRIKSINLSHNKLKNFLQPINLPLLNTVVFEDSFQSMNYFLPASLTAHNTHPNQKYLNLEYLDNSFTLFNTNLPLTLCDFLSPKGKKGSSSTQMDDDLLNEVIFSHNDLPYLSANHLTSSQCKHIQLLRLPFNQIAFIDKSALNFLINLEQLDLSSNLLTNLENDLLLSKNTHLRVLNLSQNKLRALGKDLLLHLTELEELFLQDNQLSWLPTELFAQNYQLKTLDLSNNKLIHLDKSLFSNLKQLKLLNLRFNYLKQYTSLIFTSLQDINHSSTGIQSLIIPINFEKNTNGSYGLKILSKGSSNDAIKKRKMNDDHHYPSRTTKQKLAKKREYRQVYEFQPESGTNTLILSHNHIDFFQLKECNQFHENLQLLLLDHNKLTILNITTFKCFQYIQRLDLHANHLTSINESSFSNMSQLEYIDLSSNLISSIPLGTFVFSKSLRHVDLSRNRLIEFKFMDTFAASLMMLKSALSSNSLLMNENDAPQIQLESLKLGENSNLSINFWDLHSFINNFTSVREIQLAHIKQISAISGNGSDHYQTSFTNFSFKLSLELLNLSSVQVIENRMISSFCDTLISIERLDLSNILFSHNRGEVDKSLTGLIRNKLDLDLLELSLAGDQLNNEQVRVLFSNLTDSEKQLTVLDLSSNQLQNWPIDQELARRLSKLRTLNLSKNRLRYFIEVQHKGGDTAGVVKRYELSHLESLDLSFNALVGIIEHQTESIRSISTIMPHIKHLDVSHNRLIWLPAQLFDNLSELSSLKLNHNQLDSFTFFLSNQHLLLDLSFNHKLAKMSITLDLKPPEFTSSPLYWDFDNLVLFESHDYLLCYTIDDYVRKFGRVIIDETANDGIDKEISLFTNENHETREESCSILLSNLQSIRFDQNPLQTNLDALAKFSDNFRKLIHLRHHYGGLTLPYALATMDGEQLMIILDLSFNKIDKIPRNFCYSNSSANEKLKSFTLSNNELLELSLSSLRGCKQLIYLDVSHNKISSLTSLSRSNLIADYQADDVNSKIMVLKLNNNMLTTLHNSELLTMRSLRLVDLRANPLRVSSIIMLQKRPLFFKILTDSSYEEIDNDKKMFTLKESCSKPRLDFDGENNNLLVKWSSSSGCGDGGIEKKGEKYLMRVIQMDELRSMRRDKKNYITSKLFPSSSGSTFFHLIKFCTLRAGDLTLVCIGSSESNTTTDDDTERCFYLKRPSHIPSCVTDLQERQREYKSSMIGELAEHSSSSNLNGLEIPLQFPMLIGGSRFKDIRNNSLLPFVLADAVGGKLNENREKIAFTETSEDPILNLIEFLKRTWLRIKEFSVNEYLTLISNIQSDSIWTKIDGTYPIYTMTLVKVAIVGGSTCIIVLLVLVFALTTFCSRSKCHQISAGKSINDNNTCRQVGDATESSSLMTSKAASDSGSDPQTSFATSINFSSSLISNTKNIGSSLVSEIPNKSTVIEKSISDKQQQILDVKHLIPVNQQVHPQICSTPSSSLAPSSVETGETLQAVDSIQSNQQGLMLEQPGEPGDGEETCVDQYGYSSALDSSGYQQYKQPVATVMRMVKSSSTGFDPKNAAPATYGTLNASRMSNYSTLKLKIRALNEQQQQMQRYNHQFILPTVVPPSFTESNQAAQSCSSSYSQQQQQQPSGVTYAPYVMPESLESNEAYRAVTNQMELNQEDPTTLSLLSINTALSNSNYNSSLSQQVSPDATGNSQQVGGFRASLDELGSGNGSKTTNKRESGNNTLCQYHHRYLLRQDPATNHSDLVKHNCKPITREISSAAAAASNITRTNVILEQDDEEQYQQNNNNNNNSNELLLMSNLPPPPMSRAIEALENPVQYMLLSSSSSAGAIGNQRERGEGEFVHLEERSGINVNGNYYQR